ncbi:ribonuclease H2, subunit B [Lyophyllum atratum]|nr:ribonuclease H2, subunit B [Lyophyllum atratum]
MTTHMGVLPIDLIHALSATLEQKDASTASLSFIRLPHPRTGLPSLFLPSETPSNASLPYTQSRILEVQAVSPPDSRSWFLDEEVVADGKLLIMTPVDPAFLLIPILQAAHPNDGSPGTYRPVEDIFEDASVKLQLHATPGESDNSSPILCRDILRFGSLAGVKDALKHLCDVKEITPEITVYRLSLPKVLEYLCAKVTRLSALEVLEVSTTAIRGLAKDGLMEDGRETLLQVGRTRAACDLLGHYLSPDVRALLIGSYDFTMLDAYLQTIKDDAAAAVVETKNGRTKDKATIGDEKKRKNTKGSQGVEKLKKANVNGMAKLSSFFKKT